MHLVLLDGQVSRFLREWAGMRFCAIPEPNGWFGMHFLCKEGGK